MAKPYLQADYSLQEALADIKEHSLIEGISNVIDLVNKNKLKAIIKNPPKTMFARVELESQLKPIEQDNGQSIASLTVLEEKEITVNKNQIGFTTTQFSFIHYADNNDITTSGIFQLDLNYYTSLSYDDGAMEIMASEEMDNIEKRNAWFECEPDPTKPITEHVFTYAEIEDIRITSESLKKLRPKVASDHSKSHKQDNEVQDDQFKAAKSGATTGTKADTTIAVGLAIETIGNHASNEDVYNWIKRRVEVNDKANSCFDMLEFEGDDIHPFSIKDQKACVLMNNLKPMTKQTFQDLCSRVKGYK